jgi:hypothetical protein
MHRNTPFLFSLLRKQIFQVFWMTCVGWASSSLGAEEKVPAPKTSGHGVELEIAITHGIAYRYRAEDQNFCIGIGERWITKTGVTPGVEGFLNYQRKIGAVKFPLDMILFTNNRRSVETVEDFGRVEMNRREYRAGIGLWLDPTVQISSAVNLYFPIGFGLSYPFYMQSQVKSDTTERAINRDLEKKIEPYVRLGVGYAF